jgi:branched-chain amino acid transport system substrate-binding protein
MNRSIAAVLIVSAAAPSAASAQELTVYSSMPLTGVDRTQARAINDGARLALQQAGGTVAGRPVRLETLNSATRQAGSWTPESEAANAYRAARVDASTIAYIGGLNSGATAYSLPILNEAGIPQISPSSTYSGLTVAGTPGEPDKFYPSGRRTFFRLTPNDTVQATVLAGAMRDSGCRRVAAVHDQEIYDGAGMHRDLRAAAARIRLPIVVTRSVRAGTRRYGPITRARPDCVVYTGVTANGAVRLFRNVGRGRRLFASDGVADSGFARSLPRSLARRITITAARLPRSAFPPEGQEVIGTGGPYKAYGYEAMRLIINGINLGGPTRDGVLGFLRNVRNRVSVLGTYGFDANGDTTLRTIGLYTIRGRALRFVRRSTPGEQRDPERGVIKP